MHVTNKRKSRSAFLTSAALAAFGLTAILTKTAAAQTTTNLLTNPGAETGNLTGWTVGGDSNPNVDNGAFDPGINPHTGSYDFYGHTGDYGTLTQAVALTGPQGLSVIQIDGGAARATVGFWEQGLNQGPPSDDALITLTFVNASGSTLSTFSTAEVDSHLGVWQFASGSTLIPVGTRSANYTMYFIRHVGSDNDAFVDDNSLTLTAAPEPSQFAAFGTGLLGLGTLALRDRRRQADAS